MATQEQVFLRWVELNLRAAGETLAAPLELRASFQDGTLLGSLIAHLARAPLPFKLQANLKNKLQMVTNISNVLKFISEQGVRVTLSAEDVYDGKDKLILGLLWVLILKYQVKSRDDIMRWVQAHCATGGVTITNFTSDWVSGVAFVHLMNSIQGREVIALSSQSATELLAAVFSYIEQHLNIPAILDAAAVGRGHVDERSMLTYLSFLYNLHPALPSERAPEPLEPSVSLTEFEALQRRCAHLEAALANSEATRAQVTERANNDLQQMIANQRRTVEQLRLAREANETTRRRIQELSLKLGFMGPSVNSIAPPSGQVALVVSSVEGASEIWGRAPQTMADALSLHNQIIRSQLSINQGYEVSAQGDVFTLAFSSASDAVHFCLAVQQRLLNAEWPEELLALEQCSVVRDEPSGNLLFAGLRAAMVVHYGTAVLGKGTDSGQEEYLGPASVAIAQLAHAARAGEILVSASTMAHLSSSNVDASSMSSSSSSSSSEATATMPTFHKNSLGKFRLAGLEPNVAGVEREDEHLVSELSQLFCVEQEARGASMEAFQLLSREEREQEKLQEELEKARLENEKLQSELQRTSERAKEAQLKAEELGEWMEKMREDMSKTQKQQMDSVYGEIAQLLTAQQELREQLASAQDQQLQQTTTMTAMSTRLRTLTSASGKLKRQYNELAEQHTQSLARIHELESMLNSQPEKVSFLQRLLGKDKKHKGSRVAAAAGAGAAEPAVSTATAATAEATSSSSKHGRTKGSRSSKASRSVEAAAENASSVSGSTDGTAATATTPGAVSSEAGTAGEASSTSAPPAAAENVEDKKAIKMSRRKSAFMYVGQLWHKEKRHSASTPTSPATSPIASPREEDAAPSPGGAGELAEAAEPLRSGSPSASPSPPAEAHATESEHAADTPPSPTAAAAAAAAATTTTTSAEATVAAAEAGATEAATQAETATTTAVLEKPDGEQVATVEHEAEAAATTAAVSEEARSGATEQSEQ